jgi:hypothetical protein
MKARLRVVATLIRMVFEVVDENHLDFVKRHQNEGLGVLMVKVKWIAKQVLLVLDYMHCVAASSTPVSLARKSLNSMH